MYIDPTPESVAAFAGSASTKDADGQPLFMLNLLRFKDMTDAGIPGVELYGQYAAATAKHLARVGGEVVWGGPCDGALIGPSEPEWDFAAVVRYPSRQAFLDMVSDAEYLETSKVRTESLADARLIPCTGLIAP